MAFSTYDAFTVVDPVTGKPVTGAAGQVRDPDTGAAVQVYDMDDQPLDLVTTNSYGYCVGFRTDEGNRSVLVTFGGVTLRRVSLEVVEAALLIEPLLGLMTSVLRVAEADYEGAVGDKDGRPSWIRFDGAGQPTPFVAQALTTVGTPIVETDGAPGFAVTDGEGNRSWISAGPDGLPDPAAVAAIANATHYYAGPVAPFVYPGNWLLWVRTTPDGDPLETLIGRN